MLCVRIVSIQIHWILNFHFSNTASEEMKVALVTFRGGDKGQRALTHCLLLKSLTVLSESQIGHLMVTITRDVIAAAIEY